MTPNISKELKKATEDLHTKMLAMQTEESKMMTLRDAFVKATDPAKKEKLKPALIKQSKILKAAEEAADNADALFHKILTQEPEEIYDLLDHKIQEHVIRLTVRRIVKEAVNEDVINEGPKPRSWNTMFAMNAIAAYEAGKFDPDDNNSLAAWEKDYNGGVKPNPGFETYDIIAYALTTGKKPDGKPINESVDSETLVSLEDDVMKFFESNKKKLEGLAEDGDWDEFYELAFNKFPNYEQDKISQAMNVAAMRAGWFEDNIDDYRQSEEELDMMANGTKEQQKGVNMGDYDKKNKLPKQSPTDIVVGDLKKLKESKKK